MKSYDIVGYSYRADIYCGGDVLAKLYADYAVPGSIQQSLNSMSVEQALDFLAETYHFDRHDESSYDSGEFPKVVFRDQL